MPTMEELEVQAMQLPADQRAGLAERLWMSVSESETAADILTPEQVREITLRQQRHRNGEGTATDFRESLNRMDQVLADCC